MVRAKPLSGRVTPRKHTPAGDETPRGGGGKTPRSHPVDGEDDTCVRVALRVRPLVAKERMDGSRMCVTADASNSRVTLGNARVFTFDHVFGPTSSQEELYDSCVAPLLEGCFLGYNATVLAYGQTGSGKTFTMGTGNNAGVPPQDMGVIPRVIRSLFQGIEEKSSEVNFMVRCQFLEVYNEAVRDLLHPDTPTSDIAIRERADGEITVAGAKDELAMSFDDCMRLLDIGSVGRVTGETDMNQQSSRSHAIFTIYVQQQSRGLSGAGGEVTSCKLHLVDLAGSERVKKSGAAGERFKETVTINQGLLALGNVISALGDEQRRATHVPYRDSKITRMLQDSLGGNSRTLMVATVSSADSCIDETVNTLKYANRARNIRNKPVVNKGVRSGAEAMDEEIRAMQLQLLKQQLDRAGAEDSAVDLDGLLSGLALGDEERAILTKALGVLKRGDEAAALGSKVGILEEELTAAQSNLCIADNAAAASAKAIFRLTKETTSLQMKVDWQQEKLAALLAAASELHQGGAMSDAARDRIVDLCSMEWETDPSRTPSRRRTGTPPSSPPRGLLNAALHDSKQQQQHSDPAAIRALEEQLREVRRQAAAAEEGLEAAEQRCGMAEEALREATDDLARDEVIFADKLAEMKDLETDKNSATQQNAELKECLAEAMAEIEALRSGAEAGGVAAVGGGEEGGSGTERGAAESAAALLEEDDDVMIGADQSLTADDSGEASRQEMAVAAKTAEVETVNREFLATRDGLDAQLRELEHNIKEKEALIVSLSENERRQRELSAQYEERLREMGAEVAEKESKVEELRAMIEELDSDRAKSEEERQRLRDEYESKLQRMEQLLTVAKRQLQDQGAAKVEKERARAKVKMASLEKEVDSMRNAQEALRRKVKESAKEHEGRVAALRKEQGALRRDLEDSQRRVRQLEADNSRQRGMLMKKAEEFARVTKQGHSSRGMVTGGGAAPADALRASTVASASNGHGSHGRPVSLAQTAAEVAKVKAELDRMMRLVSAKKEAETKVDQINRKREALAAERDKVAAARNQIELRRMRGQQAIAKHIGEMNLAIKELEEELGPLREAAAGSGGDAPRAAAEVAALEEQLRSAAHRREELEAKVAAQDFLPEAEMAAARDLDDAADSLEAELEYLSETASAASAAVSDGSGAAGAFERRVNELSLAEARALLAQYMDTLISGRERDRQGASKVAQLEVKFAESRKEVGDAQYRLRLKEMEYDRRLTELQQDHADKVNALLKQASVVGDSVAGAVDPGAGTRAGVGPTGTSPSGGGAAPLEAEAAALGSPSLDENDLQKLVKFYKEQMEVLNKDNFYYKKLARELKRKLRAELGASVASSAVLRSATSVSQSLSASQQQQRHLSASPPPHRQQQQQQPSESPAAAATADTAAAEQEDGQQQQQQRPSTLPSSSSSRPGSAAPRREEAAAAKVEENPGPGAPQHRASKKAAPEQQQQQQERQRSSSSLTGSRARLSAQLSNYKNRIMRSSGGNSR